tara:strand:- start:269 stop:1855 length:1587 start_codon:yes stop_codon:yes gene_type:complete
MKSRLAYLSISGIIIISIFIGTFILRHKDLKQIPNFNKNPYNAPISSNYIPTNSNIIFHWKLNPTLLPKYIEQYQDQVNKNLINNKISFIRDSSFKLISLDFAKEISNWVGDYGSFAVLNTDKQPLNEWIMVLGIKDNVNIEEELESISDSINFDDNTKSVNSYSKLGTEIISKKINSNHSIYLAKSKDNMLISSNPKIIISAINQSDNNALNTKEKYKYIQIKDNLNDGFLLLEISPKKSLDIIGQEKNLLELNEIKNLISSINIDKNKLNLEGILTFDVKSKMLSKPIYYNLIDIKNKSETSKDIILVDNPNQYFKKGPINSYEKFIASLIKESSTSDYSNLFKLILENTKGNLLWINDEDWYILTKRSDTSKKEISDILKKDEFYSSNLDFMGRKLEVWSKISTYKDQTYHIKEVIEAIIDEKEETYIWSQNLSSFSNLDNINYLQNYSEKEQKENNIVDFSEILEIHLGEEKTKTFLNDFYPYILFKTMLGNKLTPPQSIDISIAVPAINYSDFIKFQINLKTS